MKICKNELLLLGGMYQVLAVVLSMFNNEYTYAMVGMLYILFWVAVLFMSLSLVSSWGFVHKMNEAFPRISVFLASVGWIPYFAVIYAVVSMIADYIVMGSDSVTVFLSNYMPVYDVYLSLIVISLLYATYKVFYKKEDLAMSCYNYNKLA